ncbi:alpha-L-fucosidase [Kockovaella imperatae]|uniref:Alpha-L-fucosidase n=1 Tax=Kockovaella imperatae TaxID=4999 RepID=A0A1Y1UG21_9TREE|nr:alpha-L-fucosidase [Kockovaella imperatae]ORX37010.1 alpha-L-fucosidase [Kockovaella imperatae]
MSKRLWYTSPALAWLEALPVGNGKLGAMIYGGLRKERIQLNEDTFWSGGSYDADNENSLKYRSEVQNMVFSGRLKEADQMSRRHLLGTPDRQCSYQPLGDLWIEMNGSSEFGISDYHRDLDIDTAEATVRYKTYGMQHNRRIICSPTRSVLAIQLTADEPIDCSIYASSPQPQSNIRVWDSTVCLSGTNGPENGIEGRLRFEVRLNVQVEGGVLQPCKDHLRIRGATQVVILCAAATNYQSYNQLAGDPRQLTSSWIDDALRLSFDQLAAEATTAHQNLFRRVHVELPETSNSMLPTNVRLDKFRTGADDPALLALNFQYGRYLLICSSRPGSQAANLQGVWNDSIDPPWGSKFTININTEMNYWSSGPANMSEVIEPLLRLVKDLALTGKETARVMYNARGWVAHHNTDLWRATAPINLPRYGLWPMGGVWLLQNLWDHYEFTLDPSFLEELYPLMADACLFFIDTLVKDPNTGFLVTCPSMSPENVHGVDGDDVAICAGPTMDMQLLRDLFTRTSKAASMLGRDESLRKTVVTLCGQLRPTEIGSDGSIKEWQDDWSAPETHHRHISHLYGLYPSFQISVDKTPELARAAARTLEIRKVGGTGWSTAWHINCWARLHDAEKAYEALERILQSDLSYPNLFSAHPPLSKEMTGVFQIDGNLGSCAGFAEMLVQGNSEGDVWLLPALPKQWPRGRCSGLCVRGGVTVSLMWGEGRLISAQIAAARETGCTVHYAGLTQFIGLREGQVVELDSNLHV